MSDTSHGTGWWQASDGKWYPPELHPDYEPPSSASPPNKRPRPPLSRRWWFIGSVAVVAVIVIATALSAGKKKSSVHVTPLVPSTSTSSTAAPAPPSIAAPPTTLAPAPPPTPAPAPPPLPPTTAAGELCGAPPNPMGYNLCGRGSQVYSPDPSTCSYFNCIGNFSNGRGYMVQCNEGSYSMSGGRRGACSTHGGEGKPVYSGP